MAQIVKNRFNEIYTIVKKEIKDICPNATTENSGTSLKFPTMAMTLMDMPAIGYDFQMNEGGVNISIQTDVYTQGAGAKNQGYDISEKIRSIMSDLGFRCTFGYVSIPSSDGKCNRVTCRFTRLLGAGDILRIN